MKRLLTHLLLFLCLGLMFNTSVIAESKLITKKKSTTSSSSTTASTDYICVRGPFGWNANQIVNAIYTKGTEMRKSFHILYDENCEPSNGLKITKEKFPDLYQALSIENASQGSFTLWQKLNKLFANTSKNSLISSSTTASTGCMQGDCDNGYGRYVWPNGDKYVGRWKDLKFHGQGTFTWGDGEKHSGEWKDNKKEGKGTRTYADGRIIKGLWKNDVYQSTQTTSSSTTTSSSSTTTSSSSESTGTYYPKAPSIYSKVKEKRYIRKIIKVAKKRMIEEGQQGKKYHYVFGSDEKKKAFTINDFEEASYDELVKACNYKIKVEDCRVVFDDYYDHEQAMSQQSAGEDAKIAKQLEPYKRICREIGYSVGTDRFGDCVMKLIQRDKKSGEAQAMENANRIERAKILLGLSQMFGQPKQKRQSTSNNQKDMRNLKCTNTSVGFGGVITNCKAF